MDFRSPFPLALLSLLALPGAAAAQWGAMGNPVCTAPRSQAETRAVSDGAHGVIVAWADIRYGGWDVYAQRLGSGGQPLWALDGVPVCRARGDQDPLGMVSDGAGGAIVVWHDYRCGSAVYAQRIDGDGHVLWGPDGVALADAASEQAAPLCTSDGAGGVLAFWQDGRGYEIYGQRIDAGGNRRWGAAGLPFLPAYVRAAAAADGAGGAFLAYAYSGSLFAQRVDSTGVMSWPGGATLCAGTGGNDATVVPDGAGGMIAAWVDPRLVSHDHIYAQRIGPDGSPQWAANGVAVCIANNEQNQAFAVSDGANGAIVTWADWRSGAQDLYVRRIGANGDTLWHAQGLPLCTAGGGQTGQWAIPDGQGGAIVGWADGRGADFDVYAQHVTLDGVMRWAVNGIPLCAVAGDQNGVELVTDGRGGAIGAWNDGRVSIANFHVYAQRVDSSGATASNTGVPRQAPGGFRVLAAAPNPARAGATIVFDLPAPARVTVEVFDMSGRLVRAVANRLAMAAGRQQLAWDGRDARGVAVHAGLYFVRLRAGDEEGRCKIVVVH